MAAHENAHFSLGNDLFQHGEITWDQLKAANRWVKQNGGMIGVYLLGRGHIDQDTIPGLLSGEYGFALADPDSETLDPEVAGRLSWEEAVRALALPLRIEAGKVVVAMVEPVNREAIGVVENCFDLPLQPMVVRYEPLIRKLREHYGLTDDIYRGLEEFRHLNAGLDLLDLELELELDDFELIIEDEPEEPGLEVDQEQVRTQTLEMITRAVHAGAQAVHLDPHAEGVLVRFRREGVLRTDRTVPRRLSRAIMVYLKILAGLDITEKNAPQTNRFQIRIDDRVLEFRMVLIPTPAGDALVIHLESGIVPALRLEDTGLEEDDLALFRRALDRKSGLVLLIDPEEGGGPGLMHPALLEFDPGQNKIVAVEWKRTAALEGVLHLEYARRPGAESASLLTAVRAMDPDVVGIDNLQRDAFNSLTGIVLDGRLVLAGLHGEDVPAGLARLARWERRLDTRRDNIYDRLSSILTLAVAQARLRRVCPECRVPVKVDARELLAEGVREKDLDGFQVFKGAGCEACDGLGYQGAIGVFEAAGITPRLRQALIEEAGESSLRRALRRDGVRSLRENALRKLKAGLTTLEEVRRKTFLYPEE